MGVGSCDDFSDVVAKTDGLQHTRALIVRAILSA